MFPNEPILKFDYFLRHLKIKKTIKTDQTYRNLNPRKITSRQMKVSATRCTTRLNLERCLNGYPRISILQPTF